MLNWLTSLFGKSKPKTPPGRLKDIHIYMSGAMEYVADAGVEWRLKFRDLSDHAGLMIKFIDPTNKPGDKPELAAESKQHQENLQLTGRFEELRSFVHDYRRKDLRFVDLSDAVVVLISPGVPQWGTANELYEAERQHKPILTIIPGGLYNLPRWLFDVVDFDLIFETVEEVVDYLVKINDQNNELDSRWVLVRKYL